MLSCGFGFGLCRCVVSCFAAVTGFFGVYCIGFVLFFLLGCELLVCVGVIYLFCVPSV